jgi:beta-N-acetylhexosaminidase
MTWPPRLPRLSREAWLPTCVALTVAIAIIVILLSANSGHLSSPAAARSKLATQTHVLAISTNSRMHPSSVGSGLGSGQPSHRRKPRPSSGIAPLSLAKAVGQLIIGTYAGPTPPASMLDAVRAGQVGAIILMGDNTTRGIAGTDEATNALQAAARSGGNPGLLIMTDQEGGEVKRLAGPPAYPAADMGSVEVASEQGAATASLLRAAGVNVDLAPVADVTRVRGFMTQEQRTFGSDPAQVANAACAFATALSSRGVAFTLKHFPGLGDAIQSADSAPVNITESASELYADDAAYRQCGHGRLAVVT